jgi:hypothetical protein
VADQDRFDLVDQARLLDRYIGPDPADRGRLTRVDGAVGDRVREHRPDIEHLTERHQPSRLGGGDAE